MGVKPRTFPSQAAFRAWLSRHHRSAAELLVRIFKTHAAHRGLTYKQALDEALCVGWIDGVRRRLDADSFSIRFSPRQPRSIWSRINVRHVQRLRRTGRMTAAGLAAFAKRTPERTGVYSFERAPVALTAAYRRTFRAHTRAWTFFSAQAPWYQRICAHYVMSAKREETRIRRLEIVIRHSARRVPLPSLKLPKRP